MCPVFMSPHPVFVPPAFLNTGKPRERDFLKTLRLVSAPEACAPQQHGDAQDDDKGVGVEAPTLSCPLVVALMQRVPWSLTRVETPLARL